jgi:hypothetical protein
MWLPVTSSWDQMLVHGTGKTDYKVLRGMIEGK